jgi:hypothetical protein
VERERILIADSTVKSCQIAPLFTICHNVPLNIFTGKSGKQNVNMNITLRGALLVDAVFEVIVGLIFVLGAGALAAWTGWDAPALFALVGLGLIGVGVFLWWLANQRPIKLEPVWAVMILNAAFAVVGVALLILLSGMGVLTDGAKWLIGVIAVLLGVIAALEYVAMRGSRAR